MFALVFRFPAGRYHATPWGRNVNEADVAWPPEPWRILRALIATFRRKGDRERWSEEDLSAFVDVLAEELPVYQLPDGVVHAHTRHYMPQGRIEKGREATSLVFDAFARLPSDAEIVAAWPKVTLPEPLFALAADLARGIGYLGRAESWAECEALAEWVGEPNCAPESEINGAGAEAKTKLEAIEPVRLIAPCAAADYAAERKRLLTEFDASARDQMASAAANASSEKKLAKEIAKKRAEAFGKNGADGQPFTLPERLIDALALDTSDFQRFGWSRPPASREAVYLRAPLTPTPRVTRPRIAGKDDAARFTVARFVLAGRPRPRIEDAVKIGELMRLAALSKFDWATDEASGRRRPNAPSVISGRGDDNQPLRGGEHRHAFWLPEDADGDGEIDHMVVYAKAGLSAYVRSRLDLVTRLWMERSPQTANAEQADAPAARKEWRLALEGFGVPEEFRDASPLLGRSRNWSSVTPFLAAGHLKTDGYTGEIKRLAARRGLPEPIKVTFLRPDHPERVDADGDPYGPDIGVKIHGRLRRAIHFHRFRSRSRERQPDTIGTFLKVTFAEAVEGPLALGYGCHFGLGLFASCAESG